MKIARLTMPILSIFLCLSLDLKATETYRWVDSKGKVHFSDRKPVNQNITSVNIAQIETLKFHNVKTKHSLNVKQKKRKKHQSKPASQCHKLKQQIANLEKTLSKRQAAKDFDDKNKQLVSLRWQKIKNC